MTHTKRDTMVLQVGGLGVGLTTPHRNNNNLLRNLTISQMLMKGVWKSDLIMATWNVRTMLILRKMKEFSKEMMMGRRKGRPRLRWVDNVLADLKVMKIKQWMEKMKDREKWRLIVEEAKAYPGL